MKAMQWRSPRGTSVLAIVSVSFDEATLSPVRAASSISTLAARNSRPSAGTRLPASIRTTSPGTKPSASISMACPSRRTRAVLLSIFSSAARLASAFDSWFMPRTALNTVSPRRTKVVPSSWTITWLTTAAPTSSICMKSRYWRTKVLQPGSFFLPASLLPPYFSSLRRASSALRPCRGRPAAALRPPLPRGRTRRDPRACQA